MCGLCGVVQLDLRTPVDGAAVPAMTEALRHRGPDDSGYSTAGPVALGHRRLAIIDRSPAGAQPMSNDDGSVTIVYNGEIYDHARHRPWLEARGHRFRSGTDTEVLLRLYEELGAACLHELRGMFAFALWDRRHGRLLLARDRLGQKPLYYWGDGDLLVFASELGALLQHPAVPRDLDWEALHDYLSFGYVPSPRTAFLGVRKLRPAHLLTIESGSLSESRYWSPSYAPAPGSPPTADQAAREVRTRLREALRLRLMSDVPLGVFLSGGIDSSALVALLSEMGVRPIRTFALGFGDERTDERPWARLVAERFDTEHRELSFRPEMASLLPEVVRLYDEPFADPSALPTFHLAREASREITVALNGDGGDECFAGYSRYVKVALARRWLALPESGRAALRGVASALVPRGAPAGRLDARLRDFLGLEERTAEELYSRWTLHFDRETKRRLYSPELWEATGELDSRRLISAIFRASDATDDVGRSLHVDALTYLPDQLQVKIDRASMASSLEARSPFLDHELFGYAASLPTRYKLRGGERKWILKRALRPLLPRRILERGKRGFGLPVAAWLRTDLRELAVDTLTSRQAQRGLFRPEAVRQLLDEHTRGSRNWGSQLWNLLVLELWMRELRA